jgi:tRNA A-37 threonylcarbamoyl transferase component Bud32
LAAVAATYPRRFGRYVLVELLGSGGMGEVALALRGKPEHFKLCVVKRLSAHRPKDPALEERFRREGELAAKLSDNGVPRTLEVGVCEGEPFIAQEFVDGKDLGQVMASCATSGPGMPASVALHIVMKVAKTLACVQEAGNMGVVHREVSPANVRLSWQGDVKLLDFGIARAVAQTALTQTGQAVGRPRYMAPELLQGGAASLASDVYALGVVLWELLAGRPYPVGGPVYSVVDVPEALRSAVMVALNPVAAGRYTTPAALRDALLPHAPLDAVGTAALREFLASRWDVAREARLREAAVTEAAPLLTDAPGTLSSTGASVVVRRGRATLLVGGLVVLAAAAGVGVWSVLWARSATNEAPVVATGFPVPQEAEPTRIWVPDSAAPTKVVLAVPSPVLQEAEPARTEVPDSAAPAKVVLAAPQAPAPRRGVRHPRVGQMAEPTGEPEAAGSYAALLEEAAEAYRQGSVEQALGLARKAAGLGGGARARIVAGRMLVHEGRLREAEVEFAGALRLAPDNAEAAAWLAKTHAEVR